MVVEFIMESDPMLLSHEQFPTSSKKWVLQRMHSDWYEMIQEKLMDKESEQVSLSLIDQAWRTIKFENKIHESTVFGFSQCEICSKNIVVPSEFVLLLSNHCISKIFFIMFVRRI